MPAEPGPAPGVADLPDEAWVTALAALDLMGPARLNALVDHYGPAGAWQAVRTGRVRRDGPPPVLDALGARGRVDLDRWRAGAAAIDPAVVWHAHVRAGIGVAVRQGAGFPSALRDDPLPPAVVFIDGDPDALVGPRVAIVGTRDCTRYGHDVARDLGGELSRAGVGVISGLALGIDGAAHRGALDAGGAPPIAVVGCGLDVVYPRRHDELWRAVVRTGVVLSEYPLGTPPVAWHFPCRNRLIAALADVVIVVESQERGGSMITVDEAAARGVVVMAVPGPVTSAASAGTNKVLSEGAPVVRDVTDVLLQLGLGPGARRAAAERRPAPDPQDQAVLEAVGWQPAPLEQLLLRTGLELGALTVALDRLQQAGWIDRRGGWVERIAKPGG